MPAGFRQEDSGSPLVNRLHSTGASFLKGMPYFVRAFPAAENSCEKKLSIQTIDLLLHD